MIGHLALCAAFLVPARHFDAHRRRGWAIGSRLVPLGVLAGFAGSSPTVAAFTIGADLGLPWPAAITARLLKAQTTPAVTVTTTNRQRGQRR
ncbi:hypothetical protein GCM10010249_14160 [Streptomyces roseolilacinus]|uniref:Uncharacterized protein n=1 Tax=Streptomyces roseolilacinus TaxID=66904 RepID=A0A918AXF6_9ACTN|nr:hypothetical protein GCM10010249_14160 [Streptomyces roseolilacinus]